jgi:hypothetical protein
VLVVGLVPARERFGGGLEGHLARHHLVQHDPEAVDVGTGVQRQPFQLFRGRIGQRSQVGMGKAQRFMAVEQLGNAEIHQLRQFPKTAIRHYNHVGRLQIAVDHLHPLPFHEDPLVGCFQPQANLTGQPEEALQRQSPCGQNILEGLAVQVFHHIERHPHRG